MTQYSKIVTVNGVMYAKRPAGVVADKVTNNSGLMLFEGYGKNDDAYINVDKVTKIEYKEA